MIKCECLFGGIGLRIAGSQGVAGVGAYLALGACMMCKQHLGALEQLIREVEMGDNRVASKI